MKTYILLIFCLHVFSTNVQAQPVHWTYLAGKTSATEATVFIKASLGEGWHLYSQSLPEGSPVQTAFAFSPSESFELMGGVVEPEPLTKYDPFTEMTVGYFEKTVVFQQKIKLNDGKAIVKGTIQFAVCSDRQCLPPKTIEFSIPVD